MMCNNPFVKKPFPKGRPYTYEARLDSTPFPCGQCFPCRVNQSRVWTHRLLLEQTQHGESCFTTLTYNDANIPENGNLDKTHLQKFLKRLRKNVSHKKLRFFAVGEYGAKSYRPHYHLALFGIGINHADTINSSWNSGEYAGDQRGYTLTGDLNKDSARYMTGYISKKVTGRNDEYLKTLKKEFMTCSKMKGGIGFGAIQHIAKELKQNPYFKPKVINELGYGKKSLPLGRYLTDKMNIELGIPEDVIENLFMEYQDNLFDKHIDATDYVGSIISEKEPERKQQRRRFEIYKRKSKV